MEIEDLEQHIDSNDGYCKNCKSWTSGGVEPDAEEYECEVCGEHAVFGAEQAMFLGLIDLTD